MLDLGRDLERLAAVLGRSLNREAERAPDSRETEGSF
jgi:hypothetical protein